MLRERFLIAKNTCENFSALRADRSALHNTQSALRAPPSTVRYDSEPYHFFYAAAAPDTSQLLCTSHTSCYSVYEYLQFSPSIEPLQSGNGVLPIQG